MVRDGDLGPQLVDLYVLLAPWRVLAAAGGSATDTMLAWLFRGTPRIGLVAAAALVCGLRALPASWSPWTAPSSSRRPRNLRAGCGHSLHSSAGGAVAGASARRRADMCAAQADHDAMHLELWKGGSQDRMVSSARSCRAAPCPRRWSLNGSPAPRRPGGYRAPTTTACHGGTDTSQR